MALKGSYIGFSYGTKGAMTHSSDLGILRVSDGSRFNETILPSLNDTTSSIKGRDGNFYFGSIFQNKSFTLNIAFDSLTETKLRKIKKLFGEKGIHQLILDECPYKIYTVRPTGTLSLKYIPFDNENSDTGNYTNKDNLYGQNSLSTSGERIYKGEGTITLTAFNPFAKSQFKYSDQYSDSNKSEWIDSVNLITSTATETISNVEYTIDTQNSNGNILIYNPGDMETPFKLISTGITSMNAITIQYPHDGVTYGNLQTESFDLYIGDTGICIDMDLHLIQGLKTVVSNGVTSYELSGTIYNRYITAGDFFKLPITESPELIYINNGNFTIDYSYLYF